MALVADVLSWLCLLTGSFFVLVGGVGMIRFPDLFTRLHAASVTETLGAGLLLLGMLFQAPGPFIAIKIVLLTTFLFITSPTAAHALAKAALHGGMKPKGEDLTGDTLVGAAAVSVEPDGDDEPNEERTVVNPRAGGEVRGEPSSNR